MRGYKSGRTSEPSIVVHSNLVLLVVASHVGVGVVAARACIATHVYS